jgi:hypothetical protein
MMKRTLYFLTLILLIGLLSFAFDQLIPAGQAHAASLTQPVLNNAVPIQKEMISLNSPVNPIVFLAIGLVCVIFGAVAVSPLLAEGVEM